MPGPYNTVAGAGEAGAVVLSYGVFINALLTFLIVAFTLFLVIRWINDLRRSDTVPAPTTRACPYCKTHIDHTATRCPNCTSEVEPAAVE